MLAAKNEDKATAQIEFRMDKAASEAMSQIEHSFDDPNELFSADACVTIPEADVPLEDELDRMEKERMIHVHPSGELKVHEPKK